ncbi:MAG: SUMF1/EgtB/PvdO family nonheme iron enzyme [Candidatus Flexifilum sp.]
MAQIFVSYSRVDSAFVEKLVRRLQQAFPQHTIWYDQAPNGLIGGDDWWDEILRSIARSDVFIYVLSNESVTSHYCQAEFTEARRLQKRIVTIQARDRTRLTDDLDDIQFIDMKNGPDDADALPRLFAAIAKQIELAQLVPSRALWQPVTPRPDVAQLWAARPANAPDITTPPLGLPAAELETMTVERVRRRPRWPIALTAALGLITVVGLIAVNVLNGSVGRLLNGSALERSVEYSSAGTGSVQDAVTRPHETPAEIVTAAASAPETAPVMTASPDPTPAQTTAPTATGTAEPTPIAAATAVPALPPLEAALAAARAFTGDNHDWSALYPGGFQHAFADGVTMVLVPTGCFPMGSASGYRDEQPVHEQCFAEPFWIDRTEVTRADFVRLGGRAENTSDLIGDQRPMYQITWFEARDFCALRGARLPTEAEWEYAARGPDGWIYPWGNEWDPARAIWGWRPEQGSADVGSIPTGASWVGALDLSGSVWEWTSSLYQRYPYDPTDGREADTGSQTDVVRVLRGGSGFNASEFDLRASARIRFHPDHWNMYRGFRCARAS